MTPSELKSIFQTIAENEEHLLHGVDNRVSFFDNEALFNQAQLSQGDSPLMIFGGVNSRFQSNDINVVNQLYGNYVDIIAKVKTSLDFEGIDTALDLCDVIVKNIMKALMDLFEQGSIDDFDPSLCRAEEIDRSGWVGFRFYYEIKNNAFIN